MSGVESLLHESRSWFLSCNAMTDVVLLQLVCKVLIRNRCLYLLKARVTCVGAPDWYCIASGLGNDATSEAEKYHVRAANVWWRCAQYFVIASCG